MEPANNEHLEKLFHTFVNKNRRGRYISLLEKKDGLETIAASLDHKFILDLNMKYAQRFTGNSEALYQRLMELGAPQKCYIISAILGLHNQVLDLKEAVVSTFGQTTGTLISCLPGVLVYYEFDEENGRYILYKNP